MEQKSQQYHPISVQKLLDGPTTIDWLVDPIIPPGTSGLLAGESGVGKTWLILALAIAISTGSKFLGHFRTKPGSVLIVDEENAELLLRVRLKMMLTAAGLDTDKIPINFLIGKAVNLSPNKGGTRTIAYNKLLATVRSIKPAIVIFDSLTRVHRANENNANEIAAVFSNVKHLMEQTSSACLFTHHFNKSGYGSSKSGMRIRGSSDIRAFCDYSLLVDKADGGVVIHHDKARWADTLQSFSVNFESTDSTFALSYSGVKGKEQKDDYKDIWAWLVKKLWKDKLNRPDLIDWAKKEYICGQRKLDEVLKWRMEQGHLEYHNGRPVGYSLTENGRSTPAGRELSENEELNDLFDSAKI